MGSDPGREPTDAAPPALDAKVNERLRDLRELAERSHHTWHEGPADMPFMLRQYDDSTLCSFSGGRYIVQLFSRGRLIQVALSTPHLEVVDTYLSSEIGLELRASLHLPYVPWPRFAPLASGTTVGECVATSGPGGTTLTWNTRGATREATVRSDSLAGGLALILPLPAEQIRAACLSPGTELLESIYRPQ